MLKGKNFQTARWDVGGFDLFYNECRAKEESRTATEAAATEEDGIVFDQDNDSSIFL